MAETAPKRMHLHSTSGELTLKLLHATPSGSAAGPDLHVEFSANVGRYTARDVRAWLRWPDVKAFLSSLDQIVRDLRGEAILYAMSPQDLQLTVKPLDSKGHLGLTFLVSSGLRTDNGHFACSLNGGLEIELGQAEALLQWFRSAIEPPR